MRLIDKLTDDAAQQYTLISETGQSIQFFLRYIPTQQRWIFNLSYQGKILNGIALTASPNILRNFRNVLPFGLAVTSTDALDPLYLDDFASKRIKLYLLTSDEVETVEEVIFS